MRSLIISCLLRVNVTGVGYLEDISQHCVSLAGDNLNAGLCE